VRVIESTATGQINNWLLFLKVLINRNSQVGHHVGVIPSSYGDKSARHGDRWPPHPLAADIIGSLRSSPRTAICMHSRVHQHQPRALVEILRAWAVHKPQSLKLSSGQYMYQPWRSVMKLDWKKVIKVLGISVFQAI
jgi:hypothetical protein